MSVRSMIEAHYQRSTDELVSCEDFQRLEAGSAAQDAYDALLMNVVRSHMKSPKILAFLYSAAPAGEATANLLHNMLEELGLEEEDGMSHPDLLKAVARGAGFGDRLPELERLADDDLRRVILEPLMYGSLRDVAFAVMVETIAYEWMLSRVSSRIARFLASHRGLTPEALAWFTHHSEVDIQHAEEGLDSLEAYVDYYALGREEVETIVELTMRENVFIKRYFGELTIARQAQMAD